MNIQVGQGTPYGPVQGDFRYDLRSGYTALVGPNNAGKSALLQLVFRSLHDDTSQFGPARICLIPPDRQYIDTSTETGGRTLATWNSEMLAQMREQPLPFAGAIGPSRSELMKLLLHSNLIEQVQKMNGLLPRFGLATLDVGGGGAALFREIAVHAQGSGLRALLPVLAAVTNDDIAAILIDEPELSLEPRLQKALRDLLVETAEAKRVVMVATHSHLMLNRQLPESTQIVTRVEDMTSVETVDSAEGLYDLTFDLLGSSTEDLFFPRNYIIVEGASDQVIVQRVLDLLGQPASSIKVLSAQGIDEVRARASSVVRALVPLVVNDSPYAKRVVALIDEPRETEKASVERLAADLGERLFTLNAPSIEEYIPEEIYARAGRTREEDLAELERLSGNRQARNELKKEISNAIAQNLAVEDLDSISTIRDAAHASLQE
jgi:hypothetical protein